MHEIIKVAHELLVFVQEVYALCPWILVGAITSGVSVSLGYWMARFIRGAVREFKGYYISKARLQIYASFLAFFFALLIASLFDTAAQNHIVVLLHALAAGVLCPPLCDGFFEALRRRDPLLADALEQTLNTTAEFTTRRKDGS